MVSYHADQGQGSFLTYLRDTSHALGTCAYELAGCLHSEVIGETKNQSVQMEYLASRIERTAERTVVRGA
ncbi:MAG: hypothetical protein AAF922_18440 [Pseudomonadota bacterium]